MIKTQDMVAVIIQNEGETTSHEMVYFSYEREPRIMIFDYFVSQAAWDAVGHDGIGHAISQHVQGKWGDRLPAEDKLENDEAIAQRGSIYDWQTWKGTEIQIVTYLHTFTMRLFLPHEY